MKSINNDSILVKSQKRVFTSMTKGTGPRGGDEKITCTVRYDDECGNGHNSFSITVWAGGANGWGGANHEEVRKYFPQLAKYIKWHLMGSDGPMHYIANSLYFARVRENMNLPLNYPTKFNNEIVFVGIPFTFREQKRGFFDYLQSVEDFTGISVEQIRHIDRPDAVFGANYSFTGFTKKWENCPFSTLNEAEQFLKALRGNAFEIKKIPCEFNKAVKPDLDAARNCAVWPEAELEDFTRGKLEARLPAIIAEFKADVEELGMVF